MKDIDNAYLNLLDKLLIEWNSEEDTIAYKNIQKEEDGSTQDSKEIFIRHE